MRQTWRWMVVGAVVVGLTAPALAQAPATPAKPAAPAATATPAAPAAPAVKQVTGMVKTATADSVVVSTGKDKLSMKDMTFGLAADTKIMKDGKAITAKDLTDKDTVTVHYSEADGKMHAKSVAVRGKPAKAVPAKPKS